MLDFSHLQKRIEQPTTRATSERGELIEKFVTRLNNSRIAGGYKPLNAGFYASRMSHIKENSELYAFYKKLDSSNNFCALWWYYCKPKKSGEK